MLFAAVRIAIWWKAGNKNSGKGGTYGSNSQTMQSSSDVMTRERESESNSDENNKKEMSSASLISVSISSTAVCSSIETICTTAHQCNGNNVTN